MAVLTQDLFGSTLYPNLEHLDAKPDVDFRLAVITDFHNDIGGGDGGFLSMIMGVCLSASRGFMDLQGGATVGGAGSFPPMIMAVSLLASTGFKDL